MRIGRLAVNHLHRRPWWRGFRISWWIREFPPQVHFLEIYWQ